MSKKIISLLLVFVMIVGLFPVAVFAEDEEVTEPVEETVEEPVEEIEEPVEEIEEPVEEIEEPVEEIEEPVEEVEEPVEEVEEPVEEVEELGEDEGLFGGDGERVAVMVYGKSISEACMKADYSFANFRNALISELKGILANEKLPTVELYLVSMDGTREYKLEKDGVSGASFLTSFQFEADGLLSWLDDVFRWIQNFFGEIFDLLDTPGQLYRIYGAENVPEGLYKLEIRQIHTDGYTLYQPESGTMVVNVGDNHVNYVGYKHSLGSYTFNISVKFWIFDIDVDVFSVEFSMPGVFMNSVDAGFTFRSANIGGEALPGTEFLLVNRDEVLNIVNACVALGKDTFTNAMNLVGTEGFSWDELCILNKELLVWDQEGQQISFNDDAAYKLIETYWALVKASAYMPAVNFLSRESAVRLPAILKATAGYNGYVTFTENCNVTLIWSLQALLKMSNVVLSELGNVQFTEGMFTDDFTEDLVNFFLLMAQYAVEQGSAFWDENGNLVDSTINDWIYPILQNDDLPGAMVSALEWIAEHSAKLFGWEEFADAVKTVSPFLPNHAILTTKMPAGHYIMMETAAPKGYFRSPLFYTMELNWNTSNPDIRTWCYVTYGNVGVIAPYFAEEYYTYLRNFDAAVWADDVLNRITGGKFGTLIEDTLSGSTDVTAEMIAFYSHLIYNNMGGNQLYASEGELAGELTEYLYSYGRTAQNLLMFGAKVAKQAKNVVTGTINDNWCFYTFSNSLRTNLALEIKGIIKGISASIDTSGKSPVNTEIKETLDKVTDNIDTSNPKGEEFSEKVEEVKETILDKVEEAVVTVLDSALKLVKGFIGWWGKGH